MEYETLQYAATILHVSLQTARRMAKRSMIEGVFRHPGSQQWLVHIPTFTKRLEELQCQRKPSYLSSNGQEVGSGKSDTPEVMDKKYDDLLGLKSTKKPKPSMRPSSREAA